MIFWFEAEGWDGADLFDQNEVLFATGWHILVDDILDLVEDLGQLFVRSISSGIRSLDGNCHLLALSN